MAQKMSTLEQIALALVIIGGLNVGLVALAGVDAVNSVLGTVPIAVKVINILVGLSALYMAYNATMKK